MFGIELNRNSLLDRLEYSLTKKEVLQLSNSFFDAGIYPDEVIGICLSKNASKAFHAAWVLENMIMLQPESIDYYLPEIVLKLPEIKNPSVCRHFAKLTAIGLMRIAKKQVSKVMERQFWRLNLQPLEEICFLWLVDSEVKPAIKAHSMDILLILSSRQKWIMEALPSIIENQIVVGSPAIIAKGKEVLKCLAKNKIKP
jgi:hypothetical protein